jgi:hypothetical protein
VDVEIDLRHPVEADLGVGVEEHRDLDAVAGGERDPLEQRAPGSDLAGERLVEAGELG